MTPAAGRGVTTSGLIETPTMIAVSGNPPKRIAEYVGRLNTYPGGRWRAVYRHLCARLLTRSGP